MQNSDEPAYFAADAELFLPRGLEAAVPGLARLRDALWWSLPARARLMLEVADYLGVERACALEVIELDALCGIVPEPLRQRCITHAACRTSAASATLFSGPAGPISLHDLIGWVAQASASRERSGGQQMSA